MAEPTERPGTGLAERPGERAEPPTGPVDGADRPAEPADRYWRVRHLPVVLGASLALLVVATVVGGILAGDAGATGAAVGVGLVTFSYLSSTLVIAWADSVHPSLVLPFGVAMYVAKFSVIGVVMAGVASRDWAGMPALGFGVIAGVIAWTGANIWWLNRVHLARMRRAAATD
ncbi:hypothetical protein [Plantactinospora sp. CA-290183]|uniref:hypothetical protein n=1 Tax=Plantactinospora sp. CA-290183 TaxID=3240006 RepID=UPI003D8AE012